MRRLILMRHAKSDWSGGPSDDHGRPLNPRGRHASEALGQWLKSERLIPDEVLCSSAMRTRETYVRLGLPAKPAFKELRSLYLAEPEAILTAIRQAAGSCILVIGHNPGVGMTAEAILSQAPVHPQFLQYPTGATLVADFDIEDWNDAAWGNAKARHFIVPREL